MKLCDLKRIFISILLFDMQIIKCRIERIEYEKGYYEGEIKDNIRNG